LIHVKIEGLKIEKQAYCSGRNGDGQVEDSSSKTSIGGFNDAVNVFYIYPKGGTHKACPGLSYLLNTNTQWPFKRLFTIIGVPAKRSKMSISSVFTDINLAIKRLKI